jgi:hypothetical protein
MHTPQICFGFVGFTVASSGNRTVT